MEWGRILAYITGIVDQECDFTTVAGLAITKPSRTRAHTR